jgi:AcrR family transcriptional regulator
VATQQRALDTRERILDAAAQVFDARGFTGANMAEIVARAGMTKGAVYFHFDSKAEVAAQLVEEQHGTWAPMLTETKQLGLQGLDAIRQLMTSLSHRIRIDVRTRAAIRLAREIDTVELRVSSPFVDWTRDFAYHLRQAQLLGQMRGELDPVAYAVILVGMFVGVEEYSRSSANPLRNAAGPRILDTTHYSLDAMWDMVERGLRVYPAKTSGRD